MDLTSLEKTAIYMALEKDISRREKMVLWARDLPDEDPEKEKMMRLTANQLEAVRSAYQKFR